MCARRKKENTTAFIVSGLDYLRNTYHWWPVLFFCFFKYCKWKEIQITTITCIQDNPGKHINITAKSLWRDPHCFQIWGTAELSTVIITGSVYTDLNLSRTRNFRGTKNTVWFRGRTIQVGAGRELYKTYWSLIIKYMCFTVWDDCRERLNI